VLIAFLLLVVVSAVWQPAVFLQPENLRNLINQNAATGILAVGMTLVIIGGGIDLSVGSMMAFVAALMVLAMNKLLGEHRPEGLAVGVGVLVCLATGTALGLFNGLVIALGRVAPFIVTLAGLVGFRSVALALAEGGEIRSMSSGLFPALGEGGIPIPFIPIRGGVLVITWSMLAFAGVALAAGFLLNSTRYGRHLIAVGANERAARYSAINVSRVKAASYALMGLCVAVAAIGQTGRLNSVSSAQLGLYSELDAIAAVVIGGTSMTGGRGRIWSTVVGVLILGIITNMLLLAGVSPYWQGFVKGAIILIAVLIQRGHAER
jgi:ribose transport system permease protein